MTLEQIQKELDSLYTEMRSINVRSQGLKPSIHERWCQKVCDLLIAMRENIASIQSST